MNKENLEQCMRYSEMVDHLLAKSDTYLSFWTIAGEYVNLLSLSRKLHTIGVHSCNGTKYQTDESYEKACNAVYKAIEAIIEHHGLYYYHQSDPRGASLYIAESPLNSEDYNNGLAIH